jgi:rhamnose transport system permease protein
MPSYFQWFGQGQSAGEKILVLLAVLIFLAFAFAARWLGAGRQIYAVGSDSEAARLAGINPISVVFGVFVLMGALVAIGAILDSVRFGEVDPKSGMGLELQTIAAVVVGGTAINGGRGRMIGSLLGVILLGTIGGAMVFLSPEAHWDKAIQGGIILLAVATDGLGRRRGRHV